MPAKDDVDEFIFGGFNHHCLLCLLFSSVIRNCLLGVWFKLLSRDPARENVGLTSLQNLAIPVDARKIHGLTLKFYILMKASLSLVYK